MEGLPQGTVTFLFTDVEGSTELLTRIGKDAYGELLGEHHRLVDAAVADADGHVVDIATRRPHRSSPRRSKARSEQLGASISCTRSAGWQRRPEREEILNAETGAPVFDRLDEPPIAAAHAAGRAMSQADAIAYALATVNERAPL